MTGTARGAWSGIRQGTWLRSGPPNGSGRNGNGPYAGVDARTGPLYPTDADANGRGRKKVPHAIIFVPGSDATAESANEAAAWLSAALQAERPGGSYRWARDEADFGYGPAKDLSSSTPVFSAPVHHISDTGRTEVDVYTLDYRSRLTGDWQERPLPLQVLTLTRYLIAGFGKVVPALFRRGSRHGKNVVHQAQALWMVLLLLVVSVYFGLLAVALAQAVSAAWDSLRDEALQASVASDDGTGPSQETIQVGDEGVGGYVPPDWWVGASARLESIQAALAGLGAAVLGRNLAAGLREVGSFVAPLLLVGAIAVVAVKRSRERIEQIAVVYIGVWEYLKPGLRHSEVVGQLSALITRLAGEDEDVPDYDRISIVAYSFGSIVAIDALFPFDESPAAGYPAVDELVTIGCPFDLVRTYFGRYTRARTSRASTDLEWTNVYCPRDVLGSNFRDDMRECHANQHIRVAGTSTTEEPAQEDAPGAAVDVSVRVAGLLAGVMFLVGAAMLVGVSVSAAFVRQTTLTQLLVTVVLLGILPGLAVFVPSLLRFPAQNRQAVASDAQDPAIRRPSIQAGVAQPTNRVFHAGAHRGLSSLIGVVPPGFRAHAWYFSNQPGADDARWLSLPKALRQLTVAESPDMTRDSQASRQEVVGLGKQ